MAKITRRRVLKSAAAAAALASIARPAFGAASGKIVVLSDVHIGDNSPTVWYQQKYHEPYLAALFDHVIAPDRDFVEQRGRRTVPQQDRERRRLWRAQSRADIGTSVLRAVRDVIAARRPLLTPS
jgi:hypothetical protein